MENLGQDFALQSVAKLKLAARQLPTPEAPGAPTVSMMPSPRRVVKIHRKSASPTVRLESPQPLVFSFQDGVQIQEMPRPARPQSAGLPADPSLSVADEVRRLRLLEDARELRELQAVAAASEKKRQDEKDAAAAAAGSADQGAASTVAPGVTAAASTSTTAPEAGSTTVDKAAEDSQKEA